MRRCAALALGAALLVALLTGCDEKISTFDAGVYVKGVLDETYKGVCDGEYLNLVDITEDDIKLDYEKSLDVEYARFLYQFEIDDASLTKETKKAIMDLLAEICGKAQYTVESTTAIDDKRYAVEVKVRPIDLLIQVRDDSLSKYQEAFSEKYAGQDPEVLEEEARAQFWIDYENDWANGIVGLCSDKLGSFNYLDSVRILVMVLPDDKGFYGIGDNDFSNLCALILPY